MTNPLSVAVADAGSRRPLSARWPQVEINPYLKYVVARLLQSAVVILLAYLVIFFVVTIIPGDPIENQLRSPENDYTEAEIRQISSFYGLDKPVVEQLVVALGRFLTGDLGVSLTSNRPVATIIAEALPSTLTLASLAVLFSLALAFAIGFGAVFLPPRWGGRLLRMFPSLFLSVPNFTIGLLIIEFLSFQLGLFTLSDQHGVYAAVFPAIALAIPVSAQLTQVLITSLDTVRRQPYVTVAVAKGLSPGTIFVRQLLKPSSLPVVTVLALTIGEVLGGSVITEAVFARKGIGSVVESAVLSQDVPVLLAAVTLAAAVFIAINLLTDLIYPVLDPRLRATYVGAQKVST
ncbi:MAG: ABC transporter permease [Mycobacterium sp.]